MPGAAFYCRSILILIALTLASPAARADSVDIKEWLVPYASSVPRDPFVDPKGRVWFCGQAGAYLAYLVPDTGEFKKYELSDGAGPHNLIIDDEGFVWFAANTLPYIGKLDPADGSVVKYPMPPDTARDPHTLVFNKDGDIWFTSQRANYVGRLDRDSGDVSLVKVDVPNARPYGIRLDSKGRPWIALFGTNKLAVVEPATLAMKIYDLPRKDARVRRLEITADDTIWYGDFAQGKLGRLNPATGEFKEWAMPGGATSLPYGSALDDKGVIWLAEGGAPNKLVGFDTDAQRFTGSTEIPNSKGSIRHMYFHAPTREIWFGEDSNYLGRARVP